MCDPILVTVIKMRPHNSQSSRENATPSSDTYPLAYTTRKYPPGGQTAGTNPPYGKRWRLYILPQFLSNLTRPITHKVIFGGGGGGGGIRPCNSNIAYPRFEVYKTFLCVFMSDLIYGFHALRTVGKCTSHHLFRYGGLC